MTIGFKKWTNTILFCLGHIYAVCVKQQQVTLMH
jgi:hypothetical protein